MIDFRYHLVSLVAVFLALAIGVVLGAGPLGQELATTLEQQVEELREERGALRAELDHTTRTNEAKDELLASLTTPAVADRLTGVRVGMVLLPGADPDLADQLRRLVSVAGGDPVLTARLTEDTEDPDTAATRHEAATELAPLVADPEPREGAEPTLATVLAAVVAGADEEGGTVGQWRSAALRLEDLGLVEMEWEGNGDDGQLPGAEDQRAPQAVVVLSPGLEADPAEDPEAGEILRLRVDTVAALAEVGTPTVVAGVGGDHFELEGDSTDELVAAVRADNDVAGSVSSVDHADTRAGQVALVYAIRHALEEEYGHWGLGTGAEGPAPPVPPVMSSDDESGPGPVPPPDPLQESTDETENADDAERTDDAEGSGDAGGPGDTGGTSEATTGHQAAATATSTPSTS
ncbi:copper transporter, partial [Ornithinicoccus halotolerans]|uniref:copper transporter n=1 Tax=Ornithinicoccus halotolerans TaxID=1748220 RepID=UPI0012965F2B